MLSQTTVAHFKAFGFTVLRNLLSESEVGRLTEEVGHTLSNGYGDGYSEGVDMTVTPGFDMPMMSDDTPLASSLVADDPRFWQASHYLTGVATLPTNGEATCFLSNSKWHPDMPPTVPGVKFMTYLEGCSAETGQLQVLPGSHLPGAGPAMWNYLTQDPRRQGIVEEPDEWPVPAYGIDTEPGDVIAFHTNLLHSSIGGYRRLAWDVLYLEDPILAGQQQVEIVRDAILHIGDYRGTEFDHEKWPVWRDWMASAKGTGMRRTAINRLRRIGVLGTKGADVGEPDWQPRLPKPSTVLSSGAPATRR
jgi:phytanoyl-CoA dioxygenase PhyH